MFKKRHVKKREHDLSKQSDEVSCLKDDFDGRLGKPVNELVSGWMGSAGGIYKIGRENHWKFLANRGIEIKPYSKEADEFLAKHPRIRVMGSALNLNAIKPLNADQANWLERQLETGKIKNIVCERGNLPMN